MTWIYCTTITLSQDQTGLTMSAQLYNGMDGSANGGAISSGFAEIGLGAYGWYYASMPDGFVGWVKFSAASILRAVEGINPGEIENNDAKISSRTKPADTQARVTLVDTVTALDIAYDAAKTAATQASVNDAEADIDFIMAQTDKLVFSVEGVLDVNVLNWKGDTAPAMTGDAYARIGALGVGLTALASQASVDDAEADIDSIMAKTDQFVFTTANRVDATAIAVSDKTGYALTSAYDAAKTAATQASVDDMEADVDLIMAKTDNLPASPAAVGSAMTLTSGERDAIAAALLDLANAIETGLTTRGALRLALAALAGKLSGGGTNTITIRNAIADSKNRIVATVDASDNRSAIVVDVS